MLLAKFRHKYPQGSLVSELIEIDRGLYIVKALVQIDNLILATALAGASTVEAAEDAAKDRAIANLFLDQQPNLNSQVLPQSAPPAVAPQPSSSEILNAEVSTPDNEQQIVNFSKPSSEPLELNVQSQEIPPVIPTKITTPQLQLDLPEETSEGVNVPPLTETSLFPDISAAETPPVVPLAEEINDLSASELSSELEAMKFNEIKQKTDIEIKRLSWTKEQGKEFLMSRYGRKSRLHLTDEQLLEFLRYLEKLPSPV